MNLVFRTTVFHGRIKMAMAKCRECGAEVSDSAKTCPKCGISKPVKKTSIAIKLLLGLFALGVLGQVINGGGSSSSTTSSAPARPSEVDLASKVSVKDFIWKTGGFDSVMVLAKISIENKNTENVKDFEIECVHSGPSGTVIDRNKKTIFQVLPAGKTTTLKEVNMGFIHSQAAKSSCSIVSVKREN